MEERQEIQTPTTEFEKQNTDINYIDAIKTMRENSVSKEDYDKVVADNKRLLESYAKGEKIQKESEEPKMRKSSDIREELFNSGKSLTNREFIQLSCELRDAVLAETGDDIFTAHRPGEQPSEEAQSSARRTADVFKQCLEGSNGDSAMFNALLQQRMQDVSKAGRR